MNKNILTQKLASIFTIIRYRLKQIFTIKKRLFNKKGKDPSVCEFQLDLIDIFRDFVLLFISSFFKKTS